MATKRRGKGEGTIFKVKDRRDLWAARITAGTKTNGGQLRKTIYGKTKKEVTEKLTRLQNQVLDGLSLNREKMTVAEIIGRWLTNWSENLAPGTVRNYQHLTKKYIIPNLGTVEVAKLLPVHVRGLMDKLATDGVGVRTREYVFVTIRRMMNLAVKLELAIRNPCKSVDPPKSRSREIIPPQGEQLDAIRKAAAATRLEALIVLALTSGMRQGELFALAWDDVDLDAGSVFVRYSLEDLDGKVRLKEPKTLTSRRTICIGPETVRALIAHRKRMQAEGHGSRFVFCDAHGELLRKSNFHRNTWKGVREAAGLATMRFHDLRHANGSALIGAGIDRATVRDRMGHSTTAMTDRYSHALTAPQRLVAAAVESKLRIFCGTDVDLNRETDEKKESA